MRWSPEARRSVEIGDVPMVIAVLAIIALTIRTVITSTTPAVSGLVFDILPPILWSVAGVTAVLSVADGERIAAAAARSLTIVAVSVAAGLGLGASGLWSHATAASVLTPADALLSIVTGGFIPVSSGPDPMIRFLALFTGIGLLLVMWKKASRIRAVLSGIGWYVVSSLVLLNLSWIAALDAIIVRGTLKTATDAFRILLTSSPDGYWNLQQQARFLAPVGDQAGMAFAGRSAAVVYLATLVLITVVVWMRTTWFRSLVKRLATRTVGAFALVAFIGRATSMVIHPPRPSVSGVLAEVVLLAVIVTFLLWWRLRRDLEDLPKDLEAGSRLPLPSGEVSPQQAVDAAVISAAFALMGAALLGWPVLLTCLAGMSVSWLVSKQGMGWGSGVFGTGIGIASIAWCLGTIALLVGVRQYLPSPASILLVTSVSLCVGLAELVCYFRDAVDQRILPAFSILLFASLSIAASQQRFLLWSLIPFAAGMVWVARKPSRWHRFGAYPLVVLLIGIACVELFFPDVFTFS